MPQIENSNKWYVVYTRPRWEKKVASNLEAKGILYYCPLNKVERIWSDRKKIIYEPLFKGYVFVQISEAGKWDIKTVNGIVNYVYWLGKPAVVRDADIQTIKRFLSEFDDVEVVNANIEIADKVIINHGVFMDYEGLILEIAGNSAKVKITGLGVELKAVFKKSSLRIKQKFEGENPDK